MNPLKRLCPLLALAALAGACDSLGLSEDSPTEPVTIHLGGECHTDGQTILCRDTSTSTPANRLKAVEWSLHSASSGFPHGSQQKAPGDQAFFSGLRTDTYQVTQRVLATDGASSQHVYAGLSIVR
ncbi:MAG TPA: hypothetical protein VLE27_16945 [Thermoanaerobaculia bacterium]|nr:hypothetical protein [Thermoanaerobaculia bacterium]